MSLLTLYHGSKKIISTPDMTLSGTCRDFGEGFYVTQTKEAAAQWACCPASSGFVNKYELETENLNILDLYSEKYTILNWAALVMSARKYRISEASFERNLEYLTENFYVDPSEADIVKGPRADETYFFFARSFLRGKISVRQLKTLMNLGPMGEQIAVRSGEAFRRLAFCSFEGVDAVYAYSKKKTRNDGALANYYAEIDLGDEGGLYIGDILKKGIKNDDERLR